MTTSPVPAIARHPSSSVVMSGPPPSEDPNTTTTADTTAQTANHHQPTIADYLSDTYQVLTEICQLLTSIDQTTSTHLELVAESEDGS